MAFFAKLRRLRRLNVNHRNLLLGAMLAPVILRLVALLPVGTETAWPLNDVLRTASYAALAAWCVSLIPYAKLREKCVAAALLGYSLSDVATDILQYGPWNIKGALGATALELAGVISAVLFYAGRSYDQPQRIPEPDRLYCLRKPPQSVQGLIISLLGIFGSDGEYAIYCRGQVYRFRRGHLIREPYASDIPLRYHCTRGKIATAYHADYLDAMIGTPWHLFGANCVTLLGAFWRKHGADR